jgi:serine/threonine protein kinase
MLLHRSNGQLLNLNRELGGGGEGKIYTVAEDATLAAKVYHHPTPELAAKLKVMVAHPPEDPMSGEGHVSIAWPVDVLERGGKVVGFVMPKVSDVLPVHEFYNPKTRRDRCPFFNYLYLHRTARNLAAAISSLHAGGYIVGDVNESNILVSKTSLVTLVDTDSFQVKDRRSASIYPCPVGKPEFTPPELQGKTFRDLQRQPEHDRFGLAVLIFQLLMEGTHPFAGVYTGADDPPAIEARIAAGHFPYSHRSVPYQPTPIAPAWDILSPELRSLFIRCFDDGHRYPRVRPDAQTWVKAIDAAEHALVLCKANPQHRYGDHLSRCPWCDRTRILQGRDPFPSQQNARRWKTPPLKPKPRIPTPKPQTTVPARPTLSTPALYTPYLTPPSFWSEVARCKNDLLAGSAVLLATIAGVVYWSGQSLNLSSSSAVLPAAISPIENRAVYHPNVGDRPSLQKVTRLTDPHSDRIDALAIAPDGQTFASVDRLGAMKVWNLSTRKAVRSLSEHPYQETLKASKPLVAFSPDSQTPIVATVDAMWHWQQATLQQTEIPLDRLQAIAVTVTEGQTLIGGRLKGQWQLWNLTTGKPVPSKVETGDRAVALSADGRALVTAGSEIKVWDITSGELRRAFAKSRQGKTEVVALSPDGKLLATSSSGEKGMIKLWEVETGNLLHTEPAAYTTAIAFSPVDRTFLAGDRSGAIGIWQVRGWDD